MSQNLDLHVHIPAGLTGTVHLHLGAPDAAGAGVVAQDAAVPEDEADEVEEMLGRFEAFDPTSAARQVHDALVADGWLAFTPKARGEKAKSAAAYLRMVYLGRARRVTLYLNSASLVSAGKGEREFVSALPGADVQADDVYLYHHNGRAGEAISNASALSAWADSPKAAA